jgi:hypothetical protein
MYFFFFLHNQPCFFKKKPNATDPPLAVLLLRSAEERTQWGRGMPQPAGKQLGDVALSMKQMYSELAKM